jgi:hypothetical protein
MSVMAAMHEEMDDRAEQQEQIRPGPQEVRPVLFQQEERGNTQEEAHT